MEIFLKSLQLKNYCQYIDHTFNFTRPDGKPYPFVCFFGFNGAGKSNLLSAISMLTMNTTGRSDERVKTSLAKYVRNTDLDPSFRPPTDNNMLIEGTFSYQNKDYVISLTENGCIRNDFVEEATWQEHTLKHLLRLAHFMKTDSDLGFSKFQLVGAHKQDFERIIADVMRFPVECNLPTSDLEDYCTDVVVTKKNVRTHFKSMSAGERKICKAFSESLNLIYALSHPSMGEPNLSGFPCLLLLDNFEMHVYYDRHVQFVDSLKQVFDRQQIFATTHSGILIKRFLDNENDQTTELMIDLEKVND